MVDLMSLDPNPRINNGLHMFGIDCLGENIKSRVGVRTRSLPAFILNSLIAVLAIA